MSGHFFETYACGKTAHVISQCRCAWPAKSKRVSKVPCPICASAKATRAEQASRKANR